MPLQSQQETVFLAKEDLLHNMVAFHHVYEVDNVEILAKLVNAFVQVEVLLGYGATADAALLATVEARQVVAHRVEGVVTELPLVEDQVEDVK